MANSRQVDTVVSDSDVGAKDTSPAGDRTRGHFRRLRRRLRIGLVTAFVLPLIALSVYFHYQFHITLSQSDKLHLSALAESQRNTIDLFLQERVLNLFALFLRTDFSPSPSQEQVERYLAVLRRITDAFVDVGFFQATGVQVGYAGPHGHLRGKDYSGEAWFQTVMREPGGQAYHITDVYLGFREQPHFTIAVKQDMTGSPFVIRATLDPDRFYEFLRSISHEQGVDSVLVNRNGIHQVVDPDRGRLLGPGSFLPPEGREFGTSEINTDGAVLVGYAWLQRVPWALVARQRAGTAHAAMYRARRIMVLGTIALVVFILAALWVTTDRLLARAQSTEESRSQLQHQLFHAAKLASVGELAAGVAHEINNPLAIISAESGVIRDMLTPQLGMDSSPEEIREQLDYIDEAVRRARTITQKLLSLVRHDRRQLVFCNVNQVLDEVLTGLKERQFRVSNIKLLRDFDPNVPDALFDLDGLRQVFLNLINNAGDAIHENGTITLSSRYEPGWIRVAVADTGRGMTADQLERIFAPFYTTKEVDKGTGLGLSISWQIVDTMGGRIEVTSTPCVGSTFVVWLPCRHQEETSHAR